MSFPASLTTRTVKGRFVTYPDGVAAKGTVRIVLDDYMQGPTDDTVVAPFDFTIPLDVNGEFSVVLPANDDPQWTPSSYRVVITVGNKVIRRIFAVPYNETGPIDLADVINVPTPTPGQSYVLLSTKGAPSGVASLDVNGKLVTSQLPASAGGDVFWADIQNKPTTFPADPQTVAWTDVQSKPTTFPPSGHTHLTSDVSGLDTALTSKAPTASPTFTGTVSGISAVMVGLGNVDNTSDAAKPVSTAQQTALNAKAPLVSPTFTGTPAAPTASAGTNTTQLATTAFVAAGIAANGPKILVLSAAAAVPGGTPAGTIIIRTTT